MSKKIINNIADKFVYQVQETDSFKKGDLVLISREGFINRDTEEPLRGYSVARVSEINEKRTEFEYLNQKFAGSFPSNLTVLKITKTDNPSLGGIPKFI